MPPEFPAGPGYGEVLRIPAATAVARSRVRHYADWLAERGLATPATATPATDGPATDGTADYADLWQWSVDEPGPFWDSIWDYFEVLGDRGDGPAVTGSMPDVTWYAGATLNYARNALRWADTDPDRTAVIFDSELGRSGRLSYGALAAAVGRVRAGLAALGVGRGDRVAAYLPNTPEALIGLLATASLGAIWTSCSPDFGASSVIERFAQISPRVLLACDGYGYNGKCFDRRPEVAAIAAELPGLEALIVAGYLGTGGAGVAGVTSRVLSWDELSQLGPPDAPLTFDEVPFEHPLWVLYSSGTTGLPKAIVHSHGGIVLDHLKSVSFQHDLGPGDVFFWSTSTGWMMWNYLVGGLLAGVTIVAYDGSAVHPGPGRLWELAAEHGVTYAGTGAPYLMACLKAGLRPALDYDLTRLRGVGSTGSPLPPEGFRWVYDQVASADPASDFILGSFSGGTDVATGFVGPCPLLPVRAGVIPGRCLGARVEAFDPAGHPVIGEVGELVITKPMPSMPIGFWNDTGGKRHRSSYFSEFPGVWRHGDWIMITEDGGCVIYGRSDATLNRGGVRMGTAEFYRVVESLPEVADSLVVDTGQLGSDGQLILYVVPAPGRELDQELTGRLRAALRSELSPRHVPDQIVAVPGVPRTLSGKKLEVPVRRILLGTPAEVAADPSALANPEVLAHFTPLDAS